MTESIESSAPSGGSEELVQEQQQGQQEANGGKANGGHQQSPAAGGGRAMAFEVEAVDVPAAAPIEVVVVNGGGTEKKARRTSSVAVSRKQTKSVALTDPPAEETRPPCFLEKANLWSILTFGCVCLGFSSLIGLIDSVKAEKGGRETPCVCYSIHA